jgi:cytochrome c556
MRAVRLSLGRSLSHMPATGGLKVKFKLLTSAILACCLGAGAVYAAGEVEERSQLMKQIGGGMGALGAITKGEKPYDEAAVKQALENISAAAKAFPDNFPAGSEGGSAAPAIWTNFDDFKAQSLKLGSDADAALAALPADQAGVAATMKVIGASCGTCHQTYRVKK